jgi:arginine repressor
VKRIPNAILILLLCTSISFGAQAVVTAIQGTVKKVDSAAKTVVVKTSDGTEHTLHFVQRTSVHGAEAAATGTKDAFHGLKEGSEVVAHYSIRGGQETAEEIDRVGSDGVKTAEGTISHIDRAGKTLVVKAADGTEETYRLTDHAAKDAGKEVATGSERSAKVTVYYTEEAGHKVAHFFKTAL